MNKEDRKLCDRCGRALADEGTRIRPHVTLERTKK